MTQPLEVEYLQAVVYLPVTKAPECGNPLRATLLTCSRAKHHAGRHAAAAVNRRVIAVWGADTYAWHRWEAHRRRRQGPRLVLLKG